MNNQGGYDLITWRAGALAKTGSRTGPYETPEQADQAGRDSVRFVPSFRYLVVKHKEEVPSE